jgi:hypothetical protein
VRVKWYKTRKRWRIIVPARFTGTGKKQFILFKSKLEGEAEIRRILNRGNSSRPQISEGDEAAITLAKGYGMSPEQYLDAVRLYNDQVLSVTKRATLEEACVAFLKHQQHEQRNVRTVWSDRQALRDKLIPALGAATPMTEVTLKKIDDCIGAFPPGGTRKTFYIRVKKFFKWSWGQRYTTTNLMADSKSEDRWRENTERMDVETFRRILFVAAGLEPIHPGEAPTLRFKRLLPRYVLGGLAGMRSCEIIPSYPNDPVIEWSDILWNKGLIMVRHDVAKQTKAQDRLRYPKLELAAKEWLQLVRKPKGPILEISLTRYTQLHRELRKALGLRLPRNGWRNSYASYRLSIESPGTVAKAMGDTEATMKRWYTETLEPGDGNAWFSIRPAMNKKIIQMSESVA